MRWIAIVLWMALGPVRAGDLCADIRSLLEQSRSPSGETAEGQSPLGSFPPSLASASRCSDATKLSEAGYLCRWDFPHRDRRAHDKYRELVVAMSQCAGPDASREDSGVNHPDSFSQHLFEMEEGAVSVSLKDKAELGASFVFIRVQP